MPRGRTEKIIEAKKKLLHRLEHGFYQPGDRFLSNRAVAKQFDISYQTAHRLISELCDEGHLERRPQSGTYVPGRTAPWVGVELIFNPRAKRPESFGAKLLDTLTGRLDQQATDWTLRWSHETDAPAGDRIPVIWEAPAAVKDSIAASRAAVLINDRPERGIASLFIDSVSTDDRAGGACAADLLKEQAGTDRGLAVLTGPKDDPRARQRAEGFCSIVKAPVLWADGWFLEDGLRLAQQATTKGRRGLFCGNDRLAQAVLQWCDDQGRTPPPLVGFDNAPVAESLDLTTIAIPWEELVEGVAQVVKRRLSGDRAVGSQQIFNPRPIIRRLERD